MRKADRLPRVPGNLPQIPVKSLFKCSFHILVLFRRASHDFTPGITVQLPFSGWNTITEVWKSEKCSTKVLIYPNNLYDISIKIVSNLNYDMNMHDWITVDVTEQNHYWNSITSKWINIYISFIQKEPYCTTFLVRSSYCMSSARQIQPRN